MALTFKTNYQARDIINSWELTEKEKAEFDYINFDDENQSSSFFRYKGNVYDLGEFTRIENTENQSGNPFTMKPEKGSKFLKWDGYISDTYFSGIVVKYCNEFESVIVATFYS